MYSKEQLQKLIDEVSRLIAIEELDKVVPTPSLAKAGYFMRVNAAGTGYELVQTSDSTLYYHPISIIHRGTGDGYCLSFIILNNSGPAFTKATFKAFIDNLYTQIGTVRMNCSGFWYREVAGDYVGGSPSILAKTSYGYEIIFGNADNPSTFYRNADFDEILFGESIDFADGVNQLL